MVARNLLRIGACTLGLSILASCSLIPGLHQAMISPEQRGMPWYTPYISKSADLSALINDYFPQMDAVKRFEIPASSGTVTRYVFFQNRDGDNKFVAILDQDLKILGSLESTNAFDSRKSHWFVDNAGILELGYYGWNESTSSFVLVPAYPLGAGNLHFVNDYVSAIYATNISGVPRLNLLNLKLDGTNANIIIDTTNSVVLDYDSATKSYVNNSISLAGTSITTVGPVLATLPQSAITFKVHDQAVRGNNLELLCSLSGMVTNASAVLVRKSSMFVIQLSLGYDIASGTPAAAPTIRLVSEAMQDAVDNKATSDEISLNYNPQSMMTNAYESYALQENGTGGVHMILANFHLARNLAALGTLDIAFDNTGAIKSWIEEPRIEASPSYIEELPQYQSGLDGFLIWNRYQKKLYQCTNWAPVN